MNIDYLTKMANQISDFFESQPDPAEAQLAFVRHLKNGWDPRMRAALLAHIDGKDGESLSAFVTRAVAAHRSLLQSGDQLSRSG